MQPCKYRMEKDRRGINKEGGKPQSWVTTAEYESVKSQHDAKIFLNEYGIQGHGYSFFSILCNSFLLF